MRELLHSTRHLKITYYSPEVLYKNIESAYEILVGVASLSAFLEAKMQSVRGAISVHCPELGGVRFSEVQKVQ